MLGDRGVDHDVVRRAGITTLEESSLVASSTRRGSAPMNKLLIIAFLLSGARKGPPVIIPPAPKPPTSHTNPMGLWAKGSLPIGVVMLKGTEAYRMHMQYAIDWWNTRLGREVFMKIDKMGDGGIVVVTVSDATDTNQASAKMVKADDE